MRDNTERLKDIQEAITDIEKYAVRGEKAFFENELIQVWIIHHLQIIGEASSTIPESFTRLHSEIPWQDMKDFRNLVVHEYFRVNLDTVWSITQEEIPNLKQKINQILSDLESL